jgi:hypothetical protein
MSFVPDVAAGASSKAESTIPAPTSHDIGLGPALFARASLLVHALPQFHLIAAVPQTFDYLLKTPVN